MIKVPQKKQPLLNIVRLRIVSRPNKNQLIKKTNNSIRISKKCQSIRIRISSKLLPTD